MLRASAPDGYECDCYESAQDSGRLGYGLHVQRHDTFEVAALDGHSNSKDSRRVSVFLNEKQWYCLVEMYGFGRALWSATANRVQ
jgi:hypothetical protein